MSALKESPDLFFPKGAQHSALFEHLSGFRFFLKLDIIEEA
jgi:hypothetical protein